MRLPAKKRLPKLQKFMVRQRSRKPQTWEEQLTIVKMWNAALGGTVVGPTTVQ